MQKFIAAAAKLDLPLLEVLDILGLTLADVETEDMSTLQIIESVHDLEDSGCDDWVSDSCSNFIDA